MEIIKEDRFNEVKRAAKKVPDDMWETVSAFANTDGGHIFLGFTEIKSDNEIKEYKPTGVNNPSKMIKDIIDTVNNKRKISASVIREENIKIKKINGKSIIEIYVPAVDFSLRPVYIKNDPKKVYKRVRTADQLASEEDVRAMLRDARPDDSARILDTFSIEDLNLVDLQNYKAYLANEKHNPEIVNLDNTIFLKKYGLMRTDRKDNKLKLTRGALLLFGKLNSIHDIYPGFMLDLIIKHKITDVDYTDRIYTSLDDNAPQNIYSFFNLASLKLQTLVENSFDLEGMRRKDQGQLYLRAIREALVNCLVHADYHSRQSTQVIWFDDRVIFENPGHLLVSKKEFFDPHGSVPRNELIFQTFVQAKLGEHTGSGGYRILSTMEDLNIQIPDIETNPRETKLTLWKTTSEDILKSLPQEWQKVYRVFNKKLVVTFKDIEPLFKKTWEGHKVLSQMENAGLIFKQGKGRATKYVIATNSPAVKKAMSNYIKDIQNSIYN